MEQFFFAPQWPSKAQLYTGEMQSNYAQTPTMGEYGARVRRASLRLISTSLNTAVYGIEVEMDSGRRVEDWYAHLVVGQSGWRLSAVRALALPPLFYMAMDSLAAMSPRPDSLEAMLAEMRLTASTDAVLKEFFRAHRAHLEGIAGAFRKESVGSISAAPDGLKAPTASLRAIAEDLAELHFRGAWRDRELPACVFLEIGGMIDNEVGFARCAPDKPPSMTPDRFIVMDPVAPGWYLYKTT